MFILKMDYTAQYFRYYEGWENCLVIKTGDIVIIIETAENPIIENEYYVVIIFDPKILFGFNIYENWFSVSEIGEDGEDINEYISLCKLKPMWRQLFEIIKFYQYYTNYFAPDCINALGDAITPEIIEKFIYLHSYYNSFRIKYESIDDLPEEEIGCFKQLLVLRQPKRPVQ